MSDETKRSMTLVDGFTDWGDDDGGQFVRVIQGELWKFANEGHWINGSDEKITPTREVVVYELNRVLQKWIDKMPAETRFLEPHEKSPDIETLNTTAPKSEWSKDFNGNLQGPWQLQNIVYMFDRETMEKYTFATGTIGGSICVHELKDKVKMMRLLRGAGVYPVVSPSSRFMKTRFGGRNRPHLEIKRWISFGDAGPALPQTAPLPLQDKSGARVVEEPTLREELNDSIDF
jgi:hypothetical protein